MRCSQCGLLYNEDSIGDRRLHRRVHDEVVNGLKRPRFTDCQMVAQYGSRTVIVINAASARFQRRFAQEVSLIGAGDTDLMNVAYHADEPPDDRMPHRRTGWIRTVVDAASTYLTTPNGLAWYTPFTDDGEAMVRALRPAGIFIAK